MKIETGVLAIPAHELFAGEELNLSTATAQKAVTYSSEKPEENLWSAFDNGDGTTDEGYMQSLVYCYGIPGAYYNAPFAARGYVKITGAEEGAAPEVHYTDVLRQSYLETAYRANLADGNVALETILNANTYEIKGDGQTLQSGKYGDKLNLAEAAANDGWKFTGWSLDGKKKFAADYIKGNATLVSLWDKVNGQSESDVRYFLLDNDGRSHGERNCPKTPEIAYGGGRRSRSCERGICERRAYRTSGF